jgi:hypothetical protein
MTYKKLTNAAKDQVKLGIGSMAGMAAIGAISPLAPGSAPVVSAVGLGVGLANIGQTFKTTTTVLDVMMPNNKKKKLFNF